MGTIIVLLLLVLLIVTAILVIIREKKKHSSCAFCPYSRSCNKNDNSEIKDLSKKCG